MTQNGTIPLLHARIVTGTGGGPEKTIFNTPRHLAGTPYRAHVAYLYPDGDPGFPLLAEAARARGCELVGIPERHPLDTRVLARLSRLCAGEGIRIWHGHDYKSNLYGLLLRRRHGLKLVTTVHGWVQQTSRTPLYYAVDRWCLKRYDRVIAVSQDLYDGCLALGVPRQRLELLENAIDTDEFRRRGDRLTGAAAARQAAGLPPLPHPPTGRLLIGAVGRLAEEKGFHFLIEAVDRLLGEGLDLELWIAGEGGERERLERQIAATRDPARFRLLGHRADTVALFEGFDLFALSSLREGLPNVVLEAMAMEVPVAATRSGGMGAFARHGDDALLCPPGSAEALAEILGRLARDPALRARLAQSARARIEREYSFRHRMRREVEIYDGLRTGGLGAAPRAHAA
jgi:glycosyltransferase involved in cell wall biosynthesis